MACAAFGRPCCSRERPLLWFKEKLVLQANSFTSVETLHSAADGDAEALQRLIEISFPIIRRKCPPDLREWADDIQQIVAYRLVRKFRSRVNPFRVSTFAAYCCFVQRTTINVSRTIIQRERRLQSLEELSAATGFEPSMRSEAVEVLERLRLNRCLELLDDPLEREVFLHRFIQQKSVDETIESLQARGMAVEARDVYRAVERSILRLSRLSEVRDMFEEIGYEDC